MKKLPQVPFLQVNEVTFPSQHETLLPAFLAFLKQPLQGDPCKQMQPAFGVSELVSSIAEEPFAQAACSEHSCRFLLSELEKGWAERLGQQNGTARETPLHWKVLGCLVGL